MDNNKDNKDKDNNKDMDNNKDNKDKDKDKDYYIKSYY